MRILLLIILLIGYKAIFPQNISPGIYGPVRPSFGGIVFDFKNDSMCDVIFYSCTGSGYGRAHYIIKDSNLKLNYINHPEDTPRIKSTIKYTGSPINDSIEVTIALFIVEKGYSPFSVFPDLVTIGNQLLFSKTSDTTRRFYCKLPVNKLPLVIGVKGNGTERAELLINQPNNTEIFIYSPMTVMDTWFVQTGETSNYFIQNITNNGFDFIFYSNGIRFSIPYERGKK